MAFDPLALSPFAWYDASDAATLTSSAGAVSQWNDKSGGARHLTGTAGQQPITGTRTINGLNALDFDGVDDIVKSANVTQTQPITAFAVVKSDVATVTHHALGNTDPCPTLYIDGSSRWAAYAGASLTFTGAVDTVNAHVLAADYTGTSSNIYLDGALRASGTVGVNGWAAKPISVGGQNPSGAPWDGMIGEVLIYPYLLSWTDRNSVHAYLGTKWFGIATPGVLQRFPPGV